MWANQKCIGLSRYRGSSFALIRVYLLLKNATASSFLVFLCCLKPKGLRDGICLGVLRCFICALGSLRALLPGIGWAQVWTLDSQQMQCQQARLVQKMPLLRHRRGEFSHIPASSANVCSRGLSRVLSHSSHPVTTSQAMPGQKKTGLFFC